MKIDEQQGNLFRLAFKKQQRRGRGVGFDHAITIPAQNATGQTARALIAFDEQNRFPSYRRRLDGLLLSCHHRSGSNREKEPEFSPGPDFSAELDPSAMLLNGPIYTRP